MPVRGRVRVGGGMVSTPALAEALVRTSAPEARRIVDEINRLAVFRIAAFDARAALEVAAMSREAKKRAKADAAATWAKLKYDRQIVAIAKVNGAAILYSDDHDLRALARSHGLKVVGLADLPLPPELEQANLFDEEGAQ